MANAWEDLRSTGASIRKDAEHVRALEEEKADLDAADPRVVELSEQVERLAGRLQAKATAERELGEEIAEAG
jgi:hypothetical protein